MGAAMGVVVAPGPDQMAGMAQVGKQVLVEALFPQTAVEALHEAVLHRLAGREVVPLDLTFLLPFEDRVRGELGPIVVEHHERIPPHLGDPVQLAGDTLARQQCIDDRCQAFPAEVVDHAQNAEPATSSVRADTHVGRSLPGHKPDVGNSASLSWPSPQLAASNGASEGSAGSLSRMAFACFHSQHLLQDRHVEHLLGQHLLELGGLSPANNHSG